MEMETIGYLKNDSDSRIYSISGDLTVEGNGRFWYSITSWAVDHEDRPGWYISPVVIDRLQPSNPRQGTEISASC